MLITVGLLLLLELSTERENKVVLLVAKKNGGVEGLGRIEMKVLEIIPTGKVYEIQSATG